jgi:hypothetical protein
VPAAKYPLDETPYPRDGRSRPAAADATDGCYVYVQDLQGVVYIVPDGPHMHPKVLGQVRPALYAGDLTIEDGEVTDVTNLSGTFQCDEPEGLLRVAGQLRRQGLTIQQGAVRFFPSDGSRPVVLE